MVNDPDGDMQNLLHTELDPRVTYIQGAIKPYGMVEGLDSAAPWCVPTPVQVRIRFADVVRAQTSRRFPACARSTDIPSRSRRTPWQTRTG